MTEPEGIMAEEGAAAPAAEAPAPKKKPNVQLLLMILNFVALLAAIGTFVYTKLMFERPPIVEEEEYRKQKTVAKKPPPSAERVNVSLEDIRANIATTSGQTHFVSLNMAIECANEDAADKFKAHSPALTDKLIAIFNRKQFTELNTIQGRLMLKEQLIREFNEILGEPAVTDIYYNSFVLQ